MGEQLFLLVVLLGGASVVPVLARRLRIPSAILEILFGMMLFGLFITERPHWFLFLKQAGLIFLMFIAGVEFDLRHLARQGRFVWYLLLSLVSFILMPIVFVRLGYPFYLGLAVSVTSAGVIVPVLKESGLSGSPVGRDTLGFALTGEFVSIVLITGIDIYHMHGFTLPAVSSAAKLILVLVLAVLFLKLMYLVAWWNPGKVERVMESEDPVEEGIRAIFFVAFAGALIAYGAGVEPVLGAFMVGVIFSYVFKSKGKFQDKINAVGFGFLTPFFFFGVGADFDHQVIESVEGVVFALFLTAMVFASNILPLVFHRFMKTTTLEAASVSVLLSCPLSMMIIAGTLGVKMQLITEGMYYSLIIASIISGVLYPSVFKYLGNRILASEEALKRGGAS